MDFIDALKDIQKSFKLKKHANDIYQIETDLLINDNDLLFIVVKNIDGLAVLTDYGTIGDEVDLEEEDILKICKKHNVEFLDWKLMLKYKSIKDINILIDCIDDILDTNNKQ